MPTRDVNLTIRARLRRDPELCRLTLKSALEELLDGEIGVAKGLLRNYVLARISFEKLAEIMSKKPESLRRMLSDRGNPTVDNIVAIIKTSLEHEGVAAEIKLKKVKKAA